MVTLAIETSSTRGSLALFDGPVCMAESPFPEGLLHGREITARLREILRSNGLRARDLTAIVVSRGPGSFTGLRVGVTAAKTLGFALRIPVVAASSLRVLAAGALEPRESDVSSGAGKAGGDLDLTGTWVVPVIDGRRELLAGALYRIGPIESPGGPLSSLRRSEVPDARRGDGWAAGIASVVADGVFRPLDLLEAVRRALPSPAPEQMAGPEGSASAGAPRVLVIGDASEYFLARLRPVGASDGEPPPAPLLRGPRGLDVPRARILGRLLSGVVSGARFDPESVHALEPAYLRLSDAETKWLAGRRS